MLGEQVLSLPTAPGPDKEAAPNLSVSLMIRKEKNNHSLHKQQQEVPSKVQTTSKLATFHTKCILSLEIRLAVVLSRTRGLEKSRDDRTHIGNK